MLLVAADTSGKNGSIALARGDRGSGALEVIEVVPIAGGTFSAQLIPQLAATLAKHGLHKEDIGGVAVASGPGSFTGLRVGLAAIKGLAEIMQKPIAAVSLLEVVALAGGETGTVLALLDAGRSEVYVGEYEVSGSRGGVTQSKMLSEKLLTREELAAGVAGKTVVTPDVTLAAVARGLGAQVKEVLHPTSREVAALGWERLRSGTTVTPAALDANYIRRADAEKTAPGSER
jgi:tRNA threonylcarbamoyladenosine biosynthesis protein TsaB